MWPVMKLSPIFDNIMRILLALLTIAYTMIPFVTSQHAWESPGCHMLGHTRTVQIDGCLLFNVTTNACRGYCLSYAHPSPLTTLQKNPAHGITSKAECCGIAATHDVFVEVRCLTYAGTETRTLTFKSARSCSCSICRSVLSFN